jgi:hypothetical protein
LILLQPISRFGLLTAWVANWIVDANLLSRFNPVVVGVNGMKFIRFNVVRNNKVFVTTAHPGEFLSATVSACQDNAIATVARLSTTNLMLPTTESWLGKDSRLSAALLTEFHRSLCPPPTAYVFPVRSAVREYQYKPSCFDQEAKSKLEAYMSPLIHGAFAPVPNKASEEQCVEGRINKLKKPEPFPHSFRDRCIREFADLVVGSEWLSPVCFESVETKQTGAAQKISLKKAVLQGPMIKRILKCFIKTEAYPSVKDPRNISTFDDRVKLDMSQFCLALSEHCKKFSWYGPGKTPLEIALRVAEICSQAMFVNVSDYHRMDGTISYVLRSVDRAVFMKAFGNHRSVLNELLKYCADNVGYLPHGTSFQQGPSQGSGNPDTSVAQTLRSAFTAYLAYRNVTLPQGSRYTPEEAFSKLGIHLGDDGLDPDLPVANHAWAAQRVGLVLEAAVVQRGEFGVNFLARYYSQEVWNGCPDSMCDVKRQLSKFHTTVRLPSNVPPEDKLVEKSLSYLATDRNTPVIGQLCRKVSLFQSTPRVARLGVSTWWSKFEDSVQYPNSNVGGWMDVEFERLLPEFDRTVFDQWLAQVSRLSEILEAPLCTPVTPAMPTSVAVVVDGSVLDAERTSDTTSTGKTRKTRSRARKTRVKPKNRAQNEDEGSSGYDLLPQT